MKTQLAEAFCVCVPKQEDFDNVMKEYPESSKAMDLIAEHRLRSLHASTAWQSKQHALMADKMASLGAKIEHVLEARYSSLWSTARHVSATHHCLALH